MMTWVSVVLQVITQVVSGSIHRMT
ncbi:hypothetical protein PLANTIT3_60017 [Plantibacter sp. T3]|nr:hypothetical protein PLANTIT3_60017 [Plantibacter sp. T3]